MALALAYPENKQTSTLFSPRRNNICGAASPDASATPGHFLTASSPELFAMSEGWLVAEAIRD